MKKLFLTSGIIACMACPALADITYGSTGNVAYNENAVSPASQTSYSASVTELTAATLAQFNGATVDDACVVGVLETTDGPVQLQAMWQPNFHQINLNMNTTDNGAQANPVVDPEQLWSVPGTTGIYDSYSGTINQPSFTPVNLVTGEQGNAIVTMTADEGHDVTYDFVYSAPHGRTGSGASTPHSNTRLLTKFTAGSTDAEGTTDDYITVSRSGNTVTYTLTSAGAGAASNYSAGGLATEWYAQYDCATPTFDNANNGAGPTLDGYTFTGWKDANGATVTTAGRCENDATTTLYAQWSPISYTLSFNCGDTDTSTSTLTGDASVSMPMDSSYRIQQKCAANGYVFTGWSCTSDNGRLTALDHADENWADTAITTITATNETVDQTVYLTTYGNVSCTAQWQHNTITLNWDVNYGTRITAGADSCVYDEAITLPEVSRTGYILTGWDVTAVGSNVSSPVRTGNAPALP